MQPATSTLAGACNNLVGIQQSRISVPVTNTECSLHNQHIGVIAAELQTPHSTALASSSPECQGAVQKQGFLARSETEHTKEPSHYYHVVPAGGTSWCTCSEHPPCQHMPLRRNPTCRQPVHRYCGVSSSSSSGLGTAAPMCRPDGRALQACSG